MKRQQMIRQIKHRRNHVTINVMPSSRGTYLLSQSRHSYQTLSIANNPDSIPCTYLDLGYNNLEHLFIKQYVISSRRQFFHGRGKLIKA